MVGEPFGERVPNRPGGEGHVPFRDDVTDQARRAGLVTHQCRRGAHAGHRAEGRLDLTDLHPVTADLDLAVGPAEVHEAPVGLPAGEIAGAVHPGPGRRGERVGDEPLRRLRGPVQVAARELRPGQVQLPHRAGRYRTQRVVQQIDPHAGEGAADHRLGPLQWGAHAVHGGLGRAVHVARGDAGGGDPPPQRGWRGLAAEHQQRRSVRAVEQSRVDQGRGQGGRGVHDVDAVAGEGGQQRVDVPCHLGVVEVQFVPAQQPQHLVQGGVEGERVGVRHPQSPARGASGVGDDRRALVVQQRGQAADRHLHPLGFSGGARGVNEVGEVLGVSLGGQFVRGEWSVRQRGQLGDRGRVVEHEPRRVGLHARPGARREDECRAYVGEQLPQPFGRVREVEREEGGTGVEGREQTDHEIDRARQCQGHHVLGPDSSGPQSAGEAVHAAGEFGEVHPVGSVDQRRVAAVGGGQLGERGGHVAGVARRRGRGPRGEQLAPLLGVDEFDPSHGGAPGTGQLGEELAHRRESGLDGGPVVGPGGHLESQQQATVPCGQDAESHVLGRSARDVAHDAGRAREVEGEVEGLEVDATAVQQGARSGHGQVAGQIFPPVALVRAHLPHRLGDTSGQHVQPVPAPHVHPEWEHVHGHAGGA